MSFTISTLCALVLFLTAIPGCGDSTAGQCSINADCPSGQCRENGQCNNENTPDASGATDTGSDTDAALSACGGTLDAFISMNELPMRAGLKADFRIATNAEFDTAGTVENSLRTWNLDRQLANDVDTEVTLGSVADTWYASLFPNASYTAKLSQGSDLLGMFLLQEDGLYLLGVVSPEAGLTRTELKYDPPALLMPLPLSEESTWDQSSDVSGLALGVFTFYSERYLGQVDARGELITPFGTFQVQRLRVELTRTLGLLVTKTRQFNFVSECAGIVASVVSQEDEDEVEFSSATEIRRVIP